MPLWYLTLSTDEVKSDWSYVSIAFTAGIKTSVPIFGVFGKLRKQLFASSCLASWNNSARSGRMFVMFAI
jgi:hypothetical protein